MYNTIEAINLLADKFNTTSEKLIEIFVPYVVSTAHIGICFGVVFFVMAIICLVIIKNSDDTDTRCFSAITFIICMFLVIVMITTSIPKIVAPEAAAIKEIISTIKK